ncbi:hypothetical protein BLA29_012019 [Euroglyphus maynei]|uniref:Uncharacterized protein n=1 Tax=Euroglyphus maynei TaxID=6958 RepID=A0A1Y3BLS8_EURMA|nr:hypothetical protein BLA29_012019 [Euroglyphus maynei]
MKCNKAHHILGAKVYEKKVAITDVWNNKNKKQTVKQYSTRKKTNKNKIIAGIIQHTQTLILIK